MHVACDTKVHETAGGLHNEDPFRPIAGILQTFRNFTQVHQSNNSLPTTLFQVVSVHCTHLPYKVHVLPSCGHSPNCSVSTLSRFLAFSLTNPDIMQVLALITSVDTHDSSYKQTQKVVVII